MKKLSFLALGAMSCLAAQTASAQFTTQWQLGAPQRIWPLDGVGGGPNVDFIQEAGSNPLPGSPNSPLGAQQNDDDYYFAGTYNGPMSLNATVASDELGMERAFAGTDNTLRIHFNLPNSLNSLAQARFKFEAINLHMDPAAIPDPRYGVEVRFNGEVVMSELVIRPGQLNQVHTTPAFFLGDVGALFGSGGDNILELRGINYNGDGGGNWMGLDYHSLEVSAVPEPSSLGLMIAGGVLGLGAFFRRKK